jgi:CRP-like cAMP-binding protein
MLPGVESLFATLTRFGELPRKAVSAVTALLRPAAFRKEDWLLRGSEQATLCHFIVRGLVRELYIDPDGGEHTRSFVAEGGLTGSLVDLISGEPAITWIQALEPTDTLAFVYADFRKLCDLHPSLERLARLHAEELYVRKVHREHELLALPAQARYQRWIHGSHNIDARVRRRDLASYLGITAEHLSRLRSDRRMTHSLTAAPRRAN